VGINALIERAATEGTSIVIEGAHIVPGFVDVESHKDRILAVPFILGVDDEGRHLSHFATREDAVAARPAERYTEGFENIRRLQRYVKSQALSHGVPVLPNYSFDQSIAVVMDLVMERTTQRAAEIREAAEVTAEADGSDPRAGSDRAERPVVIDHAGGQTT
jgi:2-phosphoglycerate kinase